MTPEFMEEGGYRSRKGKRPGLFAELRAVLRGPFYRHERRRSSWRYTLLAALLAVLVVLLAYQTPLACCLIVIGVPLLVAVPGALVAEGLLSEFDAETLEGLLLTPLSRRRLLWGKLIARLRPIIILSTAGPPAGALLGLLFGVFGGYGEPVELLANLGIGLAVGTLVSVLILGQSLCSGAFGVLAVLVGRTRTRSYLLLFVMSLGLTTAEGVAGGVVALAGAMLVGFYAAFSAQSSGGMPAGMTLLFWGLGLMILAVRMTLVNVLLPLGIMAYAARRMDSMLLRDE